MSRLTTITAPLIAGSVFLGAFLLFQIQPMAAKFILPWFGGTSAVWTTALLFFQIVLLIGYAYAHALTSLRSRRLQSLIHLILVAAAIVTLSVLPGPELRPEADSSPVPSILLLLTVTIGLSYGVLSASSPLLQAWYSYLVPDRSPYRLYALSNLGSLLGPLSYPFLIEPNASVSLQAMLWESCFVLYGMLLLPVLLLLQQLPPKDLATRIASCPTTLQQFLYWLLFAFSGSLLLLSITNHMCQDVASIPLLWVLPLCLYLGTFILTFESERWYSRKFILPVAALMALAITDPGLAGPYAPIWQVIAISSLALFAGCMVCHGELALMKPPSEKLTQFYLTIALGGALGGVFVGVVAPMIFTGYYELHVALFLTYCLALSRFLTPPFETTNRGRVRKLGFGFGAVLVLVLFIHIAGSMVGYHHRARNFYGILKIKEQPARDDLPARRIQYHGSTVHGFQLLSEDGLLTIPTAYFTPDSGIGKTIKLLQEEKPELRIGVVGLGIGTLASYLRDSDEIDFYEINSDVVEQAYSHFTFLSASKGNIEVYEGDGRLTLERKRPQPYDLLVLDAFSGDSIPMHLLTREAFELYWTLIKKDGVLACNTTNRHVDIRPVLVSASHSALEPAFFIEAEGSSRSIRSKSHWVFISRSDFLTSRLDSDPEARKLDEVTGDAVEWTDDYSNLLSVLRLS